MSNDARLTREQVTEICESMCTPEGVAPYTREEAEALRDMALRSLAPSAIAPSGLADKMEVAAAYFDRVGENTLSQAMIDAARLLAVAEVRRIEFGPCKQCLNPANCHALGYCRQHCSPDMNGGEKP